MTLRMADRTTAEWFARFPQVPEHLRGGLRRYVVWGIPTGGFLAAVLANDLSESVRRADEISLANLQSVVWWLYNEAPFGCWGSEEKRLAWIKRGGLVYWDGSTPIPGEEASDA